MIYIFSIVPIISLYEFFRRSRAANSVVHGPIWPGFFSRNYPRYHASPRYLKFVNDRIIATEKNVKTPIFRRSRAEVVGSGRKF